MEISFVRKIVKSSFLIKIGVQKIVDQQIHIKNQRKYSQGVNSTIILTSLHKLEKMHSSILRHCLPPVSIFFKKLVIFCFQILICVISKQGRKIQKSTFLTVSLSFSTSCRKKRIDYPSDAQYIQSLLCISIFFVKGL